MNSPLLSVRGLSVRYGGVTALDAVDIDLEVGRLVGLIGPNGAGKTTFVDAVTGFAPAEGRVVFEGSDMSGLAAHQRARQGLQRTWQSIELFDDLTIAENLMTGTDRSGPLSTVIDALMPARRAKRQHVQETLDRFDLAAVSDRMPSELSHGMRKVVGVARAFAAGPRLVLLDEPAAGLDSTESAELGQLLRRTIDEGASLMLIDHDMELVMAVCDYVYVLEKGALLSQGTPAEILADPAVVSAYLGAGFDSSTSSVRTPERPA